MEALYRALLTRLNAAAPLFELNNLKPIAHIDRFKGQYLNPELHQPYPVPAIFLKFNIVWEDKGNNTQRGNGILEVHIELENYHESYLNSEDFDPAMVDYQYAAIVHAILQGFEGDTFGALSRMTTDEDENPSNTNVTIVRYGFTIDDDSTNPYNDWVTHKLDDMITIRKPELVVPAVSDDDKFVV